MAADCGADGCERKSRTRGYCEMHYARLRRRGLMRPLNRTAEDRFWPKVDKSGDCWTWTGGTVPGGYGTFKRRSQPGDRAHIPSHRFAYEELVGPIPEGMLLDHICHNRICVNPAHLRPVTGKQNVENFSGLRADNTTGFRGVDYHRGAKRWRGRVQHNKKYYLAGWFDTPEEAAEAARQLRLSLFTHNDADRLDNR